MKNITLIIIVAVSLTFAGCGTVSMTSSGFDMAGDSAVVVNTTNIQNYEDLASYMRGRVAGVQVSPDGRNVVIRGGLPTINSVGSPLIIVDGAEMTFEQANNMVLPSDVRSITVDKEGTLYGFRGAHGVIIIRTISGSD